MVKKSVGWEGWQSVLIVAVTNFAGFKSFRSSSRLPALLEFEVEFCR